MHQQFFRIISQNPDYIKTHCIDRNNPFPFTWRRLTKNNNLKKK